jgi:ribosomal protein L29
MDEDQNARMDPQDSLQAAVRMLEAGLARMEVQVAVATESSPGDPNLLYLEQQVDGLRAELARMRHELAAQVARQPGCG